MTNYKRITENTKREVDIPLEESAIAELQYQKSWRYLDGLAADYHALAQNRVVKDRKTKYQRQLEIEAEMVNRLIPYVRGIAKKMTSRSGWSINTPRGEVRLNLKGLEVPLEDLVQEGLAAIVVNLSNYDPEKGSVSTYFSTVIAAEMYRQARKYTGLLTLPPSVFDKAKKVFRTKDYHGNKRKMLEITITASKRKTRDIAISLQAIAMYHGLRREWVNIHNTAREGSFNNSPSQNTFEGRFLKDESEVVKVEEIVANKEIQEHLLPFLRDLKPIEQDILHQRFWEEETIEEIGRRLLLNKERIKQIEDRTLQKLRKKVNHLIA